MKNYQMIQYLHKNSIILLCTHLYKKRGIYSKNINKRMDKCHKNSIILLCTHLYTKRGIYSKNINKRMDKCHKMYIQNNYILALITYSDNNICQRAILPVRAGFSK